MKGLLWLWGLLGFGGIGFDMAFFFFFFFSLMNYVCITHVYQLDQMGCDGMDFTEEACNSPPGG